ncbi:hypothetical protein DEI99_005190 [Curtobacterium sp. MCLR17_036]|uniref:hypothetical protein n=1 Tax=Curtobacterium sp. MCLR17_036 TaxID=2175620 RepID=UPI000DA8A2BF|nr:hypothetical protein [Curtobacterium sp. MCLR17_036]WIE65934.1 hypothetical protein DEI99_005190 [Curtobacterium sp. MCLR17_036]
MTEQQAQRRTKRRYAHELYPEGGEWEVRPLTVEVPYLFARATGFEVDGTGWYDLLNGSDDDKRKVGDRMVLLVNARRIAFLADAMAQGLTGDDAWAWAEEHAREESGELVWERAEHYGVRPQAIKPYSCGPEPDHHDHYTNQEHRHGIVTRVDGTETACPICTEPIPAEEATR